jgi:hypothetical protein
MRALQEFLEWIGEFISHAYNACYCVVCNCWCQSRIPIVSEVGDIIYTVIVGPLINLMALIVNWMVSLLAEIAEKAILSILGGIVGILSPGAGASVIWLNILGWINVGIKVINILVGVWNSLAGTLATFEPLRLNGSPRETCMNCMADCMYGAVYAPLLLATGGLIMKLLGVVGQFEGNQQI